MESYIYILETLLDMGSQFLSPFISLYAVYLGFSNLFIGIFNSILYFSYILTFFISFFLNNYKTIKNVLSMSLLIWGLSFLLLYYARVESLFLFSIILRAISTSIISVCYTWLISKILKNRRFEKISNLAIIYTFVTLLATITSSILIKELTYPLFIFYIPLITSILCIIILQKIKLEEEKEKKIIGITIFENIKNSILKTLQNRKLKNYSTSLFFFYLSVGIASSFFSVFLKRILNLTEFEWAIIVSIEMISFLIFSASLKKIQKKFSISSLFQVSTFLISLIPFVWVTSKNFVIIVFFSFVSGLAWQLFSILHLTYVTKNFGDVSKISFVNVFSGLGLMLGNLIGGIIAEINLEYIFYISFLFRFSSSFLFVKLISTKKISLVDAYKSVFLSFDFFSTLIKEFILQFKFLVPYNRKRNIHKP